MRCKIISKYCKPDTIPPQEDTSHYILDRSYKHTECKTNHHSKNQFTRKTFNLAKIKTKTKLQKLSDQI